MKRYNPLQSPPPKEWLALDEDERTRLVTDYHRRAGIELPNARLHAGLHMIVENQIALGDETPVRRTLGRLMANGADRHAALHAIAAVLLDRMTSGMENKLSGSDMTAGYYAELETLTIEGETRH